MNTSDLKSSTATLTPEDLALLGETASPDLPPGMTDLIKLIQGVNREVAPGDAKYIAGAAIGDYVVPRQGEQLLIKGAIGYCFLIIGAECLWPEYAPARGGFIESHNVKPADTRWMKKNESPDGREGNYRASNGNRVDETWYTSELVLLDDGSPPFVATQAFHGTAVVVGKDMLRRAGRKVAGVANPVLTKWRMTSRSESNGKDRWSLPVATIVGQFGEERGPTIEEVRLAGLLRRSLKQGLPIEPEPPEPPPEPVERTPRPMITSGRPIVRAVETPPARDHYDGPDDGVDYSEIPF